MESYQRSDVLLVFTYAPAGLGHLRVTDALHDGLPEGTHSVLLGSDDTRINYIHRFISINPFFRRIMEWFQEEGHEQCFSSIYSWVLRHSAGSLYRQMEQLLRQQWHDKKIIVVISTHFGLAHQIAAVRARLEKKFSMRIILVVQVTDATSMKIWYVEGADLLVVPSKTVEASFSEYARRRGLQRTGIVVLPYPIGKTLVERLSDAEYAQRVLEYSAGADTKINVVLPVSGAAVGLEYYERIIEKMVRSSGRFSLYLVISSTMHTVPFIRAMKEKPSVTVISHGSDRKIVEGYEDVYRTRVIGLEIVKPSEQAFKALLSPDQRGGAIMLFMMPIGKQEKDNLTFLTDHKLIPATDDQEKLYRFAQSGMMPSDAECQECLNRARKWKALRLTNDPDKDVAIINWCIRAGVFTTMSGRRGAFASRDPELASNGVEQFWNKVDGMVKNITI